jgi:uncharacterized protein YjeT (DUF2065 family)
VVDSDALWFALALVLVIEGLYPFISPSGWRNTFVKIMKMNDGQIRFFAFCSIVAGLALFWWLQL